MNQGSLIDKQHILRGHIFLKIYVYEHENSE